MALTPLLPELAALDARALGLRMGGRGRAADATLCVVDPPRGEPLAITAAAGVAAVDLAVGASTAAFVRWDAMLTDARGRILWRLADLIERHTAVPGQMDAPENGKPIATACEADAMRSARHLRCFARWPDKIEGFIIHVDIPDRLVGTRTDPRGGFGPIRSCNLRLRAAMRKLALALASGSTVVLKPSDFGLNSPGGTAVSRLHLDGSLHDPVVDGPAAMVPMQSLAPDIEDQEHNLGPEIRDRQMRKVLGFRDKDDPVSGGGRHGHMGYFVAPTPLTGVTDGMRIAGEEVFGPVLSVLTFADDADAPDCVDATPDGHAAGVWGRGVTPVRQMADRLQAGTVRANRWAETDAAAPFGGMTQSGCGREMSREAIALCSRTESVWMA